MDKYDNVIRKNVLDMRVATPLPSRRNKIQNATTPSLPGRKQLFFAISFDNFAKYLDEMKDIDITLPIECVIYDEDIITCDSDVALRLNFLKNLQKLNLKKINFKLSESTFPLYNTIMDRINWKHDDVSFLEMTVDRYPTEIKDLRLERARGKILLSEEKLLWQGDYVLNRIKDRVDPNVLEDTNKLKYVVRHYVDGLERHYDVDKLTDFDKVWLTYHFILDRDKLNIKFADEQAFYGNDGQQHLLRSEENWESKPYGTYIRRRGVCEGQARLFRILTNNWDMKIDAITLCGMSALGPHCWLGTVIDDKLYYCCTTQHLLFDDAVRRGFVPDNSEYYPKIYEVSSLSAEDKRKIEGHIKSLKR